MAKKGAALAVGLAAIAGLGLYLWGSSASAGEGEGGGPNWPEDEGESGNGPNGAPESWEGGEVWGEPPSGASYVVPPDWDPLRGLWISPDCELVVEAPGWFCGTGGPEGMTPQPFGGFACTAMTAETYVDAMAMERNGVAGYVDYLVELGMQPEEICLQILSEVSPLCADLPDDQWPDGLFAWYEGFLERVTVWWEEYWGIDFEAEAA